MCLAGAGTLQASESLRIRAQAATPALLVGEPVVVSMTLTGASALECCELSQENTAVLAADISGLTLRIATPQSELAVGEPLKLTVTWKAEGTVRDVAVEQADFSFRSVALSVNDGARQRMWREAPHRIVEKLLVRRTLSKGTEEVTNLVFYAGGYSDSAAGQIDENLLFSKPGRYSLSAVYLHEGDAKVVSNALQVAVVSPSESERQVFDKVRADRRVLAADGTRETQALLGELLQEHPSSRYLQWAKVKRFEEMASTLDNGRDPETGGSLDHLGKESLRDFRSRCFARMAAQILSDRAWGAFEEEALALAHSYAKAGGDEAVAATARKELFEKYPRSEAVKRLKAEEADDDDEGDDEDDDGTHLKPSPKR